MNESVSNHQLTNSDTLTSDPDQAPASTYRPFKAVYMKKCKRILTNTSHIQATCLMRGGAGMSKKRNGCELRWAVTSLVSRLYN